MKLSEHCRRLAAQLAGQVYAELRDQDAAQIQYQMESQDGSKITMVISIGRGADHLDQHCSLLREIGVTQPIERTIDV